MNKPAADLYTATLPPDDPILKEKIRDESSQNTKLESTVDDAYQHTPALKRFMDGVKSRPTAARDLADQRKQGPLTEKVSKASESLVDYSRSRGLYTSQLALLTPDGLDESEFRDALARAKNVNEAESNERNLDLTKRLDRGTYEQVDRVKSLQAQNIQTQLETKTRRYDTSDPIPLNVPTNFTIVSIDNGHKALCPLSHTNLVVHEWW